MPEKELAPQAPNTPSREAAYHTLAAGLKRLGEHVTSLRPEQDGALDACADAARKAKAAGQMVDRILRDEVRPHKAAIAVVEDRWRPLLRLAGSIEAQAKAVARDRLQIEEKKKREEEETRERAAAEARRAIEAAKTPAARHAAQVAEIQALLPPDDSEVVEAPLVGTSLYSADAWKWELVDLEKVPREYLELDRGKVTAAQRKLTKGKKAGEVRGDEIPGIRIYQDKVVGVKL